MAKTNVVLRNELLRNESFYCREIRFFISIEKPPWISFSGIYDTTNLVVLKFSTTVSEMTDEQIEIGLKIIKENDQSLSELIHKQAILRYTHCQ